MAVRIYSNHNQKQTLKEEITLHVYTNIALSHVQSSLTGKREKANFREPVLHSWSCQINSCNTPSWESYFCAVSVEKN